MKKISPNNFYEFFKRAESLLFLRKGKPTLLAVNFGQSSAEMICIENTSGQPKVLAYETKKFLGVGKAVDSALEKFIKEFIARYSILEKEIIISLSEHSRIEIKHLILPPLPPEELLGVAKWQLKEQVSFDLNSAWIDWQVLNEFKDKNGEQKVEMNFVVVPKEVVSRYIHIVERCGLNLIGMTSESYNLAEFIKHTMNRSEVVAILNIGDVYSTISLICQEKVYFVRKISISSRMFVQSLTKTIGTGKGKVQLSPKEADAVIDTVGVPIDEPQGNKRDTQRSHILFLLRPLIESLVREIKFSFHYFTTHFEKNEPEIFYLTGTRAYIRNLDQYLSRQIGLTVEQISSSDHFDFQEVNQTRIEKNSYCLINILGAVVGRCQSINLLRQRVQKDKAKYVKDSLFRCGVISVGIIFLFVVMGTQIQVSHHKRKLKERQGYLSQIKFIEDIYQKVHLKEDLISKIQVGTVPATVPLKLISAIIPNEIILNEMRFYVSRGQLSLKGEVFNESLSDAGLTKFMQKLEESSFVQEVSLTVSQKVESKQIFQILCDLVQ